MKKTTPWLLLQFVLLACRPAWSSSGTLERETTGEGVPTVTPPLDVHPAYEVELSIDPHGSQELDEPVHEPDAAWSFADGEEQDTGMGIAREDMPPVAPMIPTGCNPPMEFIAGDPRFSIFATAIEETGLDAVFGNVRLRATVLLPTNDAIKRTFEDEPGLSPDHLLTDYVELERLVRNHVIPMYNIGYEEFQMWEGCYDSMVEGTCIRVRLNDDGNVRLGKGGAVQIDDEMRNMNGACPTTMHAIDRLLLVDM